MGRCGIKFNLSIRKGKNLTDLFAPLNLIKSGDFHIAWLQAMNFVLKNGIDITFGDKKDPKEGKDTCQTIELTGNAIRQIKDQEIHPAYPFKMISQYCDEFTYEYLDKYLNLPEEKQFAYLYFQRLAKYENKGEWDVDQLRWLRVNLEHQVRDNLPSNRTQATTWYPDRDSKLQHTPCLQRIWIRYCGDNKVDAHLSWRSRDLHSAWQSNIIALIDMLEREVITPCNCKIIRIIDSSDSLHIYKGDLEQAKGIVEKYLPMAMR